MKQIYFFLALIIFISLFSFSKPSDTRINYPGTPPGTIKISENLYLDKNEIRNLDYLEFIYWTKKVYGSVSQEYLSILPDTTVWIALGKPYEKLKDNYLRVSEYRNYPVVGITYHQANKFSKWRSDRVMEFLLIRGGIIKHNPDPKKDSVFTIENYKSGRYGKISKIKELQYYPEYTLPDSAIFYKVLLFADSLNNYTFFHCKNKNKTEEIIKPLFYKGIKDKSDSLLFEKMPLRPVPQDFYKSGFFRTKDKYNLILNLKGNTAELTSVEGVALGGSFMDTAEIVNRNLYNMNRGKNCYTGFRNVCRYRKLDNP